MALLDRLRLRFDDDTLEGEWRAAQAEAALPMTRRAIVVLAVLVTSGAPLVAIIARVLGFESLGLGENEAEVSRFVAHVGTARIGVLIGAMLIPYAVTYTAWGRRHLSILSTWVMVGLVGGLAIPAAVAMPPEVASKLMFIVPSLMPANFFLFGMGIAAAMASTIPLLCVLVVLFLVIGFGADGPQNLGTIILTTTYLMFVCAVGAWRLEQKSRAAFAQTRALSTEKARSEELIRAILPDAVATRLKEGPGRIADAHADVTVLFSDIVGFTQLSQSMTPDALVAMLHDLFSRFDASATALGLEKIKTIGDAYMAVAGLPEPRDDHAVAAARLARTMLEHMEAFRAETGHDIDIRIGLHTGPVVAGVIGVTKFCYDLWGDTVNTAARMESHGIPGAAQCSAEVRALLADAGFELDRRGVIEVKGKGPMETFLLGSSAA